MALTATLGMALFLTAGAEAPPISRPWASPPPPQAPKIVSGPSVRKTEAGYTFSFEVNRPCDVTLRIVNGKGEVVRHFVSGMVGLARAVEPLAPGSLSQEIHWDGKDDSGVLAPGGCKIVVSAGMVARFDKFILWQRDACPRSRNNNYFTTRNGYCYVNQSAGVHLDTMRIFDARGRLVRQAWPPRLDRPGEAVKHFLRGNWGATDWDGDRVPLKICYNSWYVYGVRSGKMALTSNGRLIGVFTGVGQGFYGLDRYDFPIFMHWNPPWFTRTQMYKTRWSLAAGRDGDIYITDSFHHLLGRFRASDMSPVNSFLYNGKERLDKPRCTIGEKGREGDDEGHFRGPDDVAVNRAGNICILDGERVKVYTNTGEFVEQLGKDAFPSREPVPPGVQRAEKNSRALCFPTFLKSDSRGRLIIMNRGAGKTILESDVEGKTIKTVPLPWGHSPYHGYSDFDAHGNLYLAVNARGKSQQIWKIAPDGKRIPFGDRDEIQLGAEGDPFAFNKGLCVAKSGDIYVVVVTDKWTTRVPEGTGGARFGDLSARGKGVCQTRVDVYGPDGVLRRKGIVWSVGINDVAVDRGGNIYVIEGTMWHGAQMGGVARGRSIYGRQHWPFPYLTPRQAALDPEKESNKRYSLLSRLVKFGPGGGILDDRGARSQLWDYAGVSGVSPWQCGTECPAAQLCIDSDDRVWIPDSFLYCIKAIDGAGNEMIRVGKYGNEDCRGGGGDARHPEMSEVVMDPEIPLAYPKGMAIFRDWLFITDLYTHRVLRCRIEFADRRESELK